MHPNSLQENYAVPRVATEISAKSRIVAIRTGEEGWTLRAVHSELGARSPEAEYPRNYRLVSGTRGFG